MNADFVSITEYGLQGSNFYWNRHAQYDITQEELQSIGITDDRIFVHRDLIHPLQNIQRALESQGYNLYIKEGYRSVELYKLVHDKRSKKFGAEVTSKLLNMKDMPHSTGKSVDVTLFDAETNKEVYLRNGADDPEAFFVDFYKNKTDAQSQRYQGLQDLLVNTMKVHGFDLGTLKEYFHFNYVG